MNQSPVDAREAALDHLIKARALVQPDGTVLSADEATFDGHMTAYRLHERMAFLGGSPRPPDGSTIDQAFEFYTGRGDGPTFALPGGGMPFPGRPAGSAGASWGEAFIAARQAMSGGGFQAEVLETGSTAVNPSLRTVAIEDPRRARFLFQLFTEVDAPTGAFDYMRQSVRNLNAAIVAPGAPKPISQFKLERIANTTKVVAHVTDPVDRYTIETARLLRTFIDNELRYGVNLALDAHVVAELLAVATAGGALNLASIRSAITDIQLLELEPNFVALNPTDWETIEEEARGQDESRNEAAERKLHGVPVVVTTAIDAGTGLVGRADGDSGEIHRTGGIRIDVTDSTPRQVGEETVNDFRLNQLVFRGETKAEIAVMRPYAFVALGGS